LVATPFGLFHMEEHVLKRPPGKAVAVVKEHKFDLEKGYQYVVDMESNALDSYLILYGATRKELRRDDDGGGYPHARIRFEPETAGTYIIEATSFGRQSQGPYTIIIRKLP